MFPWRPLLRARNYFCNTHSRIQKGAKAKQKQSMEITWQQTHYLSSVQKTAWLSHQAKYVVASTRAREVLMTWLTGAFILYEIWEKILSRQVVDIFVLTSFEKLIAQVQYWLENEKSSSSAFNSMEMAQLIILETASTPLHV